MDPTFDAFLRSWPLDLWFLFALLVTAALYLRGWLVLNRRDRSRWPAGRLAIHEFRVRRRQPSRVSGMARAKKKTATAAIAASVMKPASSPPP